MSEGAWDDFAPPGVIAQMNGSDIGRRNCAAGTAAMHIVSECQGKRPPKGTPWPPTAASFRKATGDTVGGLLASQVDATSNRVYGIDPDFQVAPASVVLRKLDDGYGFHFMHRYGPISDAGFSGSPGFRENHSSFISGIRGEGASLAVKACDPLYDGRRAGIPRGPQWIPWHSFVRAGELLVIRDDGTRMIDRYGPGMLYVGFTRVPYRPDEPVKTLRYSVLFSGAGFWTYELVNGVIRPTRHARDFSGATSARSGPPAVYPWPGHSPKRLVKMAAGALKGQYVAVPQGGATLIETEVAA